MKLLRLSKNEFWIYFVRLTAKQNYRTAVKEEPKTVEEAVKEDPKAAEEQRAAEPAEAAEPKAAEEAVKEEPKAVEEAVKEEPKAAETPVQKPSVQTFQITWMDDEGNIHDAYDYYPTRECAKKRLAKLDY